ncbi:MAG: ATP-binding protein [bacterium]
MDKNSLQKNLKAAEELILFKDLRNNQVLSNLKKYLKGNKSTKSKISEIIYRFLELSIEQGLSGDLWHNYLKKQITASKNIFTLKAEKNLINKQSSLYQVALADIEILNSLFAINFTDLLKALDMDGLRYLKDFNISGLDLNRYNQEIYADIFKSDSAEHNLEALISFYKNYGSGILNKSKAFYWQQNNLKIVNNPDPITFNDLISYQKEKNKLIKNTESFLKGFHAHNVLLYGDSGTGKSSSVKALLNKYYRAGLRLIEINSSQIKELSDILDYLNDRGLYYIIFMDDLSFEEFETDYKYLKAVMEGGIESKPANVLFYATSNRRHLVREKWQDRESEVHENDILNEKLSLAERFGLTLMFNNPSKSEYLKIVKELAVQEGLEIEAEILQKKALEWSKWNNGRSGRSARQFINQLLKEKNQ